MKAIKYTTHFFNDVNVKEIRFMMKFNACAFAKEINNGIQKKNNVVAKKTKYLKNFNVSVLKERNFSTMNAKIFVWEAQ